MGFPNVTAGIGRVKGSLSISRNSGDPDTAKVLIDTPFQGSGVEFSIECLEDCSGSTNVNSANYAMRAIWGGKTLFTCIAIQQTCARALMHCPDWFVIILAATRLMEKYLSTFLEVEVGPTRLWTCKRTVGPEA